MNAPHLRLGEAPARATAEAAAPPFTLQALRITDAGWGEGWELVPAPAKRYWMDRQPFAYQCPPLVVANQWGWQVLCPTDVLVEWDGSDQPSGLRVEVDPTYESAIKSQFGEGIVTFGPPWLFRTPPGWDLMVKGPTNYWERNRAPLEGVVESWWLPYTFTLNWKLLEPGIAAFCPGEPLAQLVPVPHGTFEGARAVEAAIGTEPELEAEMRRWQAERDRRAAERVRTHHLYRKAEGVPDHLTRVPVPTVARADSDAAPGPVVR